jgi:hypothetical protein
VGANFGLRGQQTYQLSFAHLGQILHQVGMVQVKYLGEVGSEMEVGDARRSDCRDLIEIINRGLLHSVGVGGLSLNFVAILGQGYLFLTRINLRTHE